MNTVKKVAIVGAGMMGYEEYGERFKPSPLLKRKVAAKHIGRKAKRGWFDYGSEGGQQ